MALPFPRTRRKIASKWRAFWAGIGCIISAEYRKRHLLKVRAKRQLQQLVRRYSFAKPQIKGKVVQLPIKAVGSGKHRRYQTQKFRILDKIADPHVYYIIPANAHLNTKIITQ